MAYTRKNLLKRIIDIQNLYLKKKKDGVTVTHVFENHIYPIYRISRATFYKYLATNAKKELHDMEHEDKKQLKMF